MENTKAQQKATQDDLTVQSNFLDQWMKTYKFYEALDKAMHKRMKPIVEKAKLDFEELNVSVQEFNQKMYRDDGELFSQIDDNGKIKVLSFIRCDLRTKSQIKPERALALFQQKMTIIEISAELKRSTEWVKQKLSMFGIIIENSNVKFDPKIVPYGWRGENGVLTQESSEQWVIDKIIQDKQNGVSLIEIAENLMKLRLNPRISDNWRKEIIVKMINKNRKLKNLPIRG